MSVYIKEYDLMFHHIPRTGGMWVRDTLHAVFGRGLCSNLINRARRRVPKSHPLLMHYHKIRPKTIFTFVRHPFAFYESTWLRVASGRRRKAIQTKFDWHPLREAADRWHPDLGTWVRTMCDKHPGWYTRIIEQYVGPQGAEFCQFIGRTEFLREDLTNILKTCAPPVIDGPCQTIDELIQVIREVPRSNVSNRKGKTIEWNTQLRSLVARSERDVLLRFYGDLERKVDFR